MECCNHNRFQPHDLKRTTIIHTDQLNILHVWMFVICHYRLSITQHIAAARSIWEHSHSSRPPQLNKFNFLRLVAVMFRSHCFSRTLTCLQKTYVFLFVASSEWSSPDNANTTGAAIIIITSRVPVEQEIINVYDVRSYYSSFYSHIFCSGAPPRTPLGCLQRPSDPQLVCSPPSVASTFPHSKYHSHF